MPVHAISNGLLADGDPFLPNDTAGPQSWRAIAALERFLRRLGAARVRTTFFLVRVGGLTPSAAQALCADAAGPTRLHLLLDPGTFLVVDIGPRGARNIDEAESRITAEMFGRLGRLTGAAGNGDDVQVSMSVVHSWNFELADLSFVIRQLCAAPPNAIGPTGA